MLPNNKWKMVNIGLGLINKEQIEALFKRGNSFSWGNAKHFLRVGWSKAKSHSDIFGLSSKDKKELQVSERLGAPLFMRVDEKRWCQASDWKGGRGSRSLPLPRRKDRKRR